MSGFPFRAVDRRTHRPPTLTWGMRALVVMMTILLASGSVAAQITPNGDDDPSNDDTPVTEHDTVPPKPSTFDRVYDEANALEEAEFKRFHFDIGRLWNHGQPTVIYIRESFQDAGASQAFADELRDAWDIESAPEADDGLVLLATIRPRFPHTAIISASWGANTFPTGQLTVEGFQNVLSEEATPRMRVGNVNGGMTYALRRVIYDTEYGAPFPAPRTDTEVAAGWGFVGWNGVLAVALAFFTVTPGRLPLSRSARSRWWQLGGASVLTGIGLAGAVASRSNPATLLGIIAGLVLGVLAIQLGRRARAAGAARHIARGERRSLLRNRARTARHA